MDHAENNTPSHQPIPATAILSGIGALDREALCGLIVMIEQIDGLGLAKGAMLAAMRKGAELATLEKIGLFSDTSAEDMEHARRDLCLSATPDAVLMHRLWFRLVKALAVPDLPPLSSPLAHKAAAALAVRASERLSPALLAKRRNLKAASRPPATDVHAYFENVVFKGLDYLAKEDPLSFPDLVREELLNLFADDAFHAEASVKADPDIKRALDEAHLAAQGAIAAGSGWAAFAVIAGNAGFAPYILAAQASSWIPMVSGPALVSLLATLINPATVMVGVAGLAWIGMGRGADMLRSQVAARICVLLAIQGMRSREGGETRFLSGMRTLVEHPFGAIDDYLPKERKEALNARLVEVISSGKNVPAPAGPPPAPWNSTASGTDAAMTASLTAGEMLWCAAAIDDRVIAAADFSRLDDLGDPFSFAMRAHEFLVEGSDVSLRGYTAEQVVVTMLKASGHDVALAAASNTPGYDILLDGAPVQVKCGNSLSLLQEHFGKNPDIPVIANAELAKLAEDQPWADLVTTLPSFEIATVENLVGDAVGHAVDLADASVIEFALSVGLLRGGIEVAQGKLPVSDLPAWLLLDGATRGTLGLVGGKAGAWLGLVVVGPAGALVLGPALGCAALLGVGGAKGIAEKLLMRTWHEEVRAHGVALHREVAGALIRRISGLETVCRRFEAMQGRDELRAWMSRRAQDDLVAAREARADLGRLPKSVEDCMILLLKSAELAPGDALTLRAARRLQAKIESRPGLSDAIKARWGGATT